MSDDVDWFWGSGEEFEKAQDRLRARIAGLEKPRSILDERALDYGDPVKNHARIAALWSAYLGWPVQPEQVAVCMALVKISRLAHTPGHQDSIVDIKGYMDIVTLITQHDTGGTV